MDTLIEATGPSRPLPGLVRRHRRCRPGPAPPGTLAGHAEVKVVLLGKIPDPDLADLYGCADVFALCCRSRWWGLEEEGFGIVLVEAAAAGLRGSRRQRGAGEAVRDGETGLVVEMGEPGRAIAGRQLHASQRADIGPVADALASLLSRPALARRMGEAGRHRAEARSCPMTPWPCAWGPRSTGCDENDGRPLSCPRVGQARKVMA